MTRQQTIKGCACGVAASIALLGACEIEDSELMEPVPGDTDVVDPDPDAGEPDVEPACADGEVRWTMTVRSGRNSPPLPGVRICLMDAPDVQCGETDERGEWDPCLPASSDVALTFEKEGYAPLLYPIRTGEAPPDLRRHNDIWMVANVQAASYWNQIDVEFPPATQALVLVQVHEYDADVSRFAGCLAGASVTSSPEAAVGPAYFDIASNYDPDADATNVAVCFALFAFETSEDSTMTLSHPTLERCEHIDGGWMGDEPGTLRVPARAGFRTYVHAICR